MRPRHVVSPFACSARTVSMYARRSASVDGRSARFKIALSPEPMPKKARPGAMSSTVAMPDAATAGWRVIAFVTLGPMRTRRVACAHSAIVAYISRNTDWLSATPTIEQPTSSARRASATAQATERGKPQRPFHAVFVLFGYLAACTRRLELVTGIVILPQRQTALVAKQAAAVDVLPGGRLRLRVGTGWNHVEYEALNEDFHTRGRRVSEQIAVMRKLWTEPVVSFRGAHHRLEGAGINPLPVQRPIPVWMGGMAEPVLKRVAEIPDRWV